jgi:hypothetical protein
MSPRPGVRHILIGKGIGLALTDGKLAGVLIRCGTKSLGSFGRERIHDGDILQQILRQAMPLLQIG